MGRGDSAAQAGNLVPNGSHMDTRNNNSITGSSTQNTPSKPASRIRLTWGGHLYDVTDFANRHPGGREFLEKHNGQDVDAVMQDPATHQHSTAAYTILRKYRMPDSESNGNAAKLNGHSDGVTGTEMTTDFDGYVDWSKPLIGQVEDLGDRYFEWTHHQVDRPIRLFESDVGEMLTRAHWWMVPLTWFPVILVTLYFSFRQLSASPEVWPQNNKMLARHYGAGSIPLLIAVGVLFWTLLEYVIHRWLFHLKPPASSRFLIRLHFSLHGQHHKCPMDPMRLVFPPLPAAFFAVLIYLGTGLIFPSGMAQSVFAGIVSGYTAYDLTHYYIHHGGTPSLAYFRRLKSYHTLHHYKHQQLGFGISSKMWDYPFGTLIPEDLKTKKSS